MLVRLLYVSRAVGCNAQVIEDILSQCRAHNPALGVTGILCYGGGIFLQVIEGGRAAVNGLYTRLLKDPRHEQVELLHYEEITQRRFGGWTMGQVNLSKLNATVVLKYAEQPELNPYTMSGVVAQELLQELMATASIVGRV